MINKNILKECNCQGFCKEDIYGAYKLFFGTLVSGSRLKIINLLRKGKKNVSEIIKETKSEQTVVSHDLKRLKNCGFVKSEIKGKYRYYRLNNKTIKPLIELIDKHMAGHCIHILNANKLKGGDKK